jgi:predicted AAA+ superfamily ATPase
MRRKITQKLIDWKQGGAKKPLLIYGARQVGKSYAVNDFACQYYDGDFIEVNFQKNKRLNEVFALDLEPKKIIKSLEDLFGPTKKIKDCQTLVFFDEIQLCPAALTSLYE